MRKAEAIKYFKSQTGLARALGIEQPSVAAWGEYPPDARQLQIEKVTNGVLKAEPGCMERMLGLPVEPWDGKTDRRKRVRRKANHKKPGKGGAK
jgi:hypothetical protein